LLQHRKQLKQLGIAASAAVAHQRSLGVIVMPPDMQSASKSAQNEFWRHQQIALATQRVCSFRDMVQSEYKTVLQHFEALAGGAFKQRAVNHTCDVIEAPACQRDPGCEYVRDMYFWMSKAGYKDGYAIAIMKAKFHGITDLRLLNAGQLKQLHDTVVNRCRAKLGLGDPDSRNKKERGLVKSSPPEPSQPAAATPPPAIAPANGSPPPASRSREYVLRRRPAQGIHSTATQPRNPDNEPF
jgi:hypothetical protein